MSTDLRYTLGLDNSEFEAGASGAEKITSRLTTSLKGLTAALGPAAVLAYAIQVVKATGDLKDLSDRLGVGTTELQSFDFAAQKAGASSGDARQMWDKARLAVDGLQAGTEAQVKSFAKLHLTQQDLAGLTLDQSVEKIAQAYSKSKDEAGAYQAITEILGTRSAPKLMVALAELGEKGFGELNRSAILSGQVINSQAVDAIDRFMDRVSQAFGVVKTVFGSVLGVIFSLEDYATKLRQKVGDALGGIIGGLVYGSEAMTASVRKASVETTALAGSVDKTTAAVERLMATSTQLANLEEADFKRSLQKMSNAEKIEALEQRALKLRIEGANAGENSALWAEKELKARALFHEAETIARAEKQKATKAEEDTAKKTALAAEKRKTDLAAAAAKLREEEEKNKKTLDEQMEVLKKQGMSREQMIAVLRQQGFSEDEILKKLKAQNEELRIGMKIRGQGDTQLSDLALQDKANTLRKSIAGREQRLREGVSYDPLLGWERAELDRVQKEINARSNVRQNVNFFGEDRAASLYQGNIPEFERLMGYIKGQTDSEKTAGLLSEINQRLATILPR